MVSSSENLAPRHIAQCCHLANLMAWFQNHGLRIFWKLHNDSYNRFYRGICMQRGLRCREMSFRPSVCLSHVSIVTWVRHSWQLWCRLAVTAAVNELDLDRHVRSLLTDDVAQTVACSIVASRLDYGNGNGNGNENISNVPPTVDRRRITIVHECLFIGAQ